MNEFLGWINQIVHIAAPGYSRRSPQPNILVTHSQYLLFGYWARIDLILIFKKSNRVVLFFYYQGFLHKHWRFTGQQGKGGDHLLFHSTTSTRSRTLRHLFATLHVRWLLLHKIYHLIELPLELLIDNAMFICLLDELILGFCYSDLTLETGGFELASSITLVL